MNILEYMKENVVVLDGGMGTLLQSSGLLPGEYPERWNISHPDVIREIHTDYYNAGSNVVSTNTFGANSLKFSHDELEAIVKAAVTNVRFARDASVAESEKFIALDIGPSGRLLKPYGDFEFEDAVEMFAETVRLGVKYGVDLVLIETMNDSLETKAALLAVKENCDLPVFVSNAYGEDGKLMTGASPEVMAALVEGMRADAIGVNCSLGPEQLAPVVEQLLACSSLPVILMPNAGLPKSVDGRTVYDVTAEDFAAAVARQVKSGVRIFGGCCGTTPEFIERTCDLTADITPVPVCEKEISCVSSYAHTVVFGASPILIGERINPTGKKRFKQALHERDMNYILYEGIAEQERGVHILDVNVGLPDIDEVEMLKSAVYELQSVSDLPLQIDTSDPIAMEAAMRIYNGKAMINSVNGKEESMRAVFPLVKKYGGLVVALTLDESGIPGTAEGRVKIAEKILKTAAEYGIKKKDIIFDTLAMTVSADTSAAAATLGALNTIKHKLGCHTSLGVSNISFGLPSRDTVNSTFFAIALENGLSAAIMNPYSGDMMKTYFAYRALHGLDENCSDYIEFISHFEEVYGSLIPSVGTKPAPAAKATTENGEQITELMRAITKGLKDKAAELTEAMLKSIPPLDIVQNEIIPALDVVGRGFEKQTVYLPQLLMSAEAAKSSFEKIKTHVVSHNTEMSEKCDVVIATVHGDIHDIGKNIVKLLLENYGFRVTDLGRDVPPETVVSAVVERHAPIAGLSALMTTTVPAMEETIKQLRRLAPWCRVVVGGAVLTQEYADRIGADKYARDAMETVRYAESIDAQICADKR